MTCDPNQTETPGFSSLTGPLGLSRQRIKIQNWNNARRSRVEFPELASFLPAHWTETSRGHINKSKTDQMLLFKKSKWQFDPYDSVSTTEDYMQVFLNDPQPDLEHQPLLFPSSSTNHHAWCTSAMGWQTRLWTQRPPSQEEMQSESQTARFTSLPVCPYFGIYSLRHPSHTARI